MKSNRFKKPIIISFVVIGLLFLAGLLGTPYLIDLGLERWIASQGPEIGQVENIDFNPFSARMSMDNLVVETKSGRTLNISHASLQFSWKQLFRKQLYLEELTLQGAYMLVDHLGERGLRVGGLILSELAGAEPKADKPGWEVGINRFTLQDAKIAYDTPELKATYVIDRYTLTGLETWNKKKAVKMAFQGRINESPVQVDAEIIPFDTVKGWKGSIVLKDGSLELISKVRGLQEYAPAGTLDLDLQLDARLQANGDISFEAEGALALNRMQLRYEKYGVQQEQFAWQGSIAGSKTAEQGMELTVDGQLTGSGLVMADSATSLQFILGALNWQGMAEVNQHGKDLSVIMKADLDVNDIKADDRKNAIALLGLEGIGLSGIVIAGLEDIQVEQIDLHNLRLVEKKNGAADEGKGKLPHLLQLGMIQISKTSLQGSNDISIDSVRLQDFAAEIRRDQGGNWQVMVPLPQTPESSEAQPAQEAEKAAGESRPLQFSIGSLLADGSNSVRFVDESLPRPFRTTLKISELELGEIDSKDPDSASPFKVKGQVGDYGSVAFDGTVKPGDKPVSIDLKGAIGALDLPPFSSYTGKAIGYNVTSGQLDADITMKINKGMMDGVFDLRMRNLEVAQVDPDKEPQVDKQMDVPLGSALAMLRNKKDEINLELKLQGDITKPEFGIQDAINQALAKAMQFATLSYLKYTLQPFGSFIAIAQVAGKAGKEMSKVGLDPVVFPAGEIVLDETANQYLEKIKELLNDRPKLKIELCGRAVEKDRAALIKQRLATQKKEAEKSGRKLDTAAAEIIIPDEVLLDFAGERGKLVKEILVKQHDINHERIYLCLPSVDEDPAKEPYVELLLD